MKKITIGILAHVDAGKTTLCEALLYTCNTIKKLGRVDNRDTFFDTHFEERKRGITIFSKCADFTFNNTKFFLLDTPGHSDFTAETERTLQILDYAILIISGTDGVQSQTHTLLSLLEKYNVPTFIFVTKMDVAKRTKDEIFHDIASHIKLPCFDFSTDTIDEESLALLDEHLLDSFLCSGSLNNDEISSLIAKRLMIPCYFGSGLKSEGIIELLNGLDIFTVENRQDDTFKAKVYKISRDDHGKRLTFIKVLSGSVRVKESILDEKINEIRFYSGNKYTCSDCASKGDICALLGIKTTFPGQGIGFENSTFEPIVNGVLRYSVIVNSSSDPFVVYNSLKELEDEDPSLHIIWNEQEHGIEITLMGKIQTEVLSEIILDRFGYNVSFGAAHILYKETIASSIEGVGHYEPLKHYAEVHLKIEPLPRGSGIKYASSVPTDDLDLNWQNLILTHLMEKQHLGVLTGAPVTDIKFTLIAGKNHIKHTEGGDFRQATYRAVRQGLMKAKSILLEPTYNFYLEVPNECVGRAISDIHLRDGNCDSPEVMEDFTIIKGTAPVRTIYDYLPEVLSYTNGKGQLSFSSGEYVQCSIQDDIVASSNYDPRGDENNSPDSIFCSHGAGINIPWYEVDANCHISIHSKNAADKTTLSPNLFLDMEDKELEAIMLREFGPIKRKKYTAPKVIENTSKSIISKPSIIIVDGYNVIYSWDMLKQIATDNLDLAREMLVNKLVNYSSFTGNEVVVVFDAYNVPNGIGSKYDIDCLHVVYTKESESADIYIESLISEIGKNYNVKVVSSDGLIQVSAVKTGILRISSSEFFYDVQNALEQLNDTLKTT